MIAPLLAVRVESALQRGWVAWLAIAVALLAVYLPSLDHAFQYDDLHSIVENPHLRHIPLFFTDPGTFSSERRGKFGSATAGAGRLV